MCEFKTGELFVYVNGDRWELGMVKSENNSGDGYFCWYHRGDTAANTPTRCMHKLANAGWTHIEQQVDDLRELVKHLHTCNYYTSIECDDVRCDLCAYDNDIGECDFEQQMHELGIEVRE